MISSGSIKELRDRTSAGIMDCKRALTEAKGDLNKALGILKEKGAAIASKKSSRSAKEGCVETYVHLGGKIGVLIEVNCESDFVLRNEEFKKFVKDTCLQIAALRPSYVNKEDAPKDIIKKEKKRIDEFYKESCLMEQPFIKDQSITVGDYLTSVIAKIGENIIVRRFTRYEVGEE